MNPSSSQINTTTNTTTELQNEQSNFADILLQFKTIAQNSGIDLNAVMSAISQTPGEVTAPAPIPNAVNSGANGVILPMDSFALHEAELCCSDISTSFSRLSSLIGNMSGAVSGIAPTVSAPRQNITINNVAVAVGNVNAQTAETKELPKIKVQTFSEAAYEYLTVHKANKILASTLKQYKERLKLVSAVDINRSSAEQTSESQSETDAPQKKLLGDCLLTEINRTMLQKVFNQLTNYSETTVKDCRFLTRAIFKIAVDDGILERNPINSVEIEYVDSTEKEIWTESERDIIMRFAKTDKVFGLAIFILNATGIRSNEIRALKPSDYIADRKAFHISRACKTDDTIDLPKNDTDRFVILLNDDEADFIAKQLQKLEPDKYILQNTKGEYLSERSFRKKYDKFFVRLNDSRKADDPIPDYPPHNARHLWITRMLTDKHPQAVVMAMAGHKDPRVTMHYAHLNKLDVLESSLRGNKETGK